MRPAETLVDVLSSLADSEKGIRFLQSGDRELVVSYADLLSRAKGLLAWFQDKGLEAGDQVLLFVRNNLAFTDAFWACQLGGLVPVPVSAMTVPPFY